MGKEEGVLTASDLELTPAEIASRGMSVVIPGDVYQNVVELLETMVRVATMDKTARITVMSTIAHLTARATPVRPRVRTGLVSATPDARSLGEKERTIRTLDSFIEDMVNGEEEENDQEESYKEDQEESIGEEVDESAEESKE